ncbi:MAG: glycosyltransferase family 1 protein [Isosphaera sp.]|nr:glycosyltransferase family 1 protein [Isosphaera sp.]
MRVLHVSTRLILGGSQENTALSCQGQAALGHEVHLAYGPIEGPEGSLADEVERYRTPDGRRILTHTVPDMVRQISPRRDARALRQLTSLIESLRPDVVHTHSSKAGVLGRLAAWRVLRASGGERPAVVHTVHGPPFMPLVGGPAARARTGLTNALYTIAERLAARRCHRIVSVADAMTAQFLARGIGDPSLYVTVRSGMRTGDFLHPTPDQTRAQARAALGIPPDAMVFGTVARLAEHKGHADLLDALAGELRARRSWRLLWVGDGSLRSALEQRIASLGIENRVIMTGLVPPSKVPGLVRAMDTLVHPSWREGLPRTIPQALLCGVPAIAYDCDGAPEVCLDVTRVGRDRATGILVPRGDTAALRRAALWMAGHPLDRKAMGERGQVMCAAMFDDAAMVRQLEVVYRDAIRSRQSHRARGQGSSESSHADARRHDAQ